MNVRLHSDICEVVRLELDFLGTVVVDRTQIHQGILIAYIVVSLLHNLIRGVLVNELALVIEDHDAIVVLGSVSASDHDAQDALEFESEVRNEGSYCIPIQTENTHSIGFQNRSYQVGHAE